MKIKIIKTFVILAMLVVSYKAISTIQNDRWDATVISSENGITVFETLPDHNMWEWENGKGETYEVGENVTLVMFDFENFYRLDDEIVKVERSSTYDN